METTLALENYKRACDCGRGAIFLSVASPYLLSYSSGLRLFNFRGCVPFSAGAGTCGTNQETSSKRAGSGRWGSCSSQGHLNFSWRLIMAPPPVLDYLAAHEVAHLKEMNHSHRFS